jgi:uncharacterized protein (TIGR01777 family)
MQVAIAGSSGLIGTGLMAALKDQGHEVRRLVRRPELDVSGLEGVDAVVNLAGAGIADRKWTPERKQLVLESRTETTSRIAEAIARMKLAPSVFLAGSAIGFYGYDQGDKAFDESAPKGRGFLAELVERWETAAKPAATAGVRLVHLRSGIVLSTAGGILPRLALPFKLGIGGRLGSGKQYLSWITLADEVAGIIRCLTDTTIEGPVNLTAPAPVTNLEFTKALGRTLRRPTILPTPVLPLKAIYGNELVQEILLGGQRVEPARLQTAGFEWSHPTIDQALEELL